MLLMPPLIADSAAFLLLLLPLIAVSAASFLLLQPLYADSTAFLLLVPFIFLAYSLYIGYILRSREPYAPYAAYDCRFRCLFGASAALLLLMLLHVIGSFCCSSTYCYFILILQLMSKNGAGRVPLCGLNINRLRDS